MIKNLLKRFSGRGAVLDRVSIGPLPAGVTAIIGPSGAGKTTLLRLLAGLDRPSAGHILLNGKRLYEKDAPLPRVGMLPADSLLLDHLSLLENVRLPLRLARHGSQAEQRSAALASLGRVGLAPLASAWPSEISSGERQRTSLARALVGDPEILLLDEPFSHVDRPLRAELRQAVREVLDPQFQSGAGPVTLWVTHDPEDVWLLASRVVVLDSGRVIQEGTPNEVSRLPASPWIEAMLASMTSRSIDNG